VESQKHKRAGTWTRTLLLWGGGVSAVLVVLLCAAGMWAAERVTTETFYEYDRASVRLRHVHIDALPHIGEFRRRYEPMSSPVFEALHRYGYVGDEPAYTERVYRTDSFWFSAVTSTTVGNFIDELNRYAGSEAEPWVRRVLGDELTHVAHMLSLAEYPDEGFDDRAAFERWWREEPIVNYGRDATEREWTGAAAFCDDWWVRLHEDRAVAEGWTSQDPGVVIKP